MPRRPSGPNLPDRQSCALPGCTLRLTSEDARVEYRFLDRGSYPSQTRKLGVMHPDCFAKAMSQLQAFAAFADQLARDPPPEDLLGDSRPPARSSLSIDDASRVIAAALHDAAKPPVPLPRPPASGRGTT